MSKERITIPRKIREKVLKEFNHRCAICGANNPHLHHIDENPANNGLDNLLPLCPNHHLIDQHDPTNLVPMFKLRLFRKYKDPTILSSEFHPLYERFIFLYDLENYRYNELMDKVKELVNFISVLKLGEFYHREIEKLIKFNEIVALSWDGDREDKEYKIRFKNKLRDNKEKVTDLVIELLRYQNWLK